MNPTYANTEQITAVSAKPYRAQYMVWMCVLFSLLIIGRAFSGLMLYAFVATAALVFIFSDVRECISFLVFLWPITNILKAGTDSMSFCTLFFFIAVAKTLLKHQKIHIGLLMLGLPVIATNCRSGPAEILRKDCDYTAVTDTYQECDYGIITPEMTDGNNQNAIAQLSLAILALLSNRQKMNAYGSQAKERAANFSREATKVKLEEIFCKLQGRDMK